MARVRVLAVTRTPVDVHKLDAKLRSRSLPTPLICLLDVHPSDATIYAWKRSEAAWSLP
jgi:hypothetical protein